MPTGTGQGRSTFSTGDASRFREWLRAQMDHYEWSAGRMAKELDVTKGAVVRWLREGDAHTSRRPSYESLRRMADLFAVDLEMLLEYAGVEEDESEAPMTALQRETSSVVGSLPDAILAVINPMVRAVAVEGRREEVLAAIRAGLNGTPEGRKGPEAAD